MGCGIVIQVGGSEIVVEREAPSMPEGLTDQHGRWWTRWTTLIPGHFRFCKTCGAKIRTGYILEPFVKTAICAKHVSTRWV